MIIKQKYVLWCIQMIDIQSVTIFMYRCLGKSVLSPLKIMLIRRLFISVTIWDYLWLLIIYVFCVDYQCLPHIVEFHSLKWKHVLILTVWKNIIFCGIRSENFILWSSFLPHLTCQVYENLTTTITPELRWTPPCNHISIYFFTKNPKKSQLVPETLTTTFSLHFIDPTAHNILLSWIKQKFYYVLYW